MAESRDVKPEIIVTAVSIFGHVEKLIVIAKALVNRSFSVTFLAAPDFVAAAQKSGAKVIPFQGDRGSQSLQQWVKTVQSEYEVIPPGPERIAFEHKGFFMSLIPDYHDSCQKAMKAIRERDPTVPIIVIQDSMFMGLYPVLLGSPGIRPNGVIGIGITPVVYLSIDTMPFGAAIPGDSSEEGRLRNTAANQALQSNPIFHDLNNFLTTTIKQCGATQQLPFYFNALYALPDRFLQLCIPDIEYPRTDMPPGFSYIGAIQEVGLGDPQLPSWWPEIVKHDKPLIVVSSGSISKDASDLIWPTIHALKDLDILVVATLVNITTDQNFELPANVRIAKFIPFDKLFEHTDIVVNNGGYGTVQQALSKGVPLVLAGLSEDKIETNARTAWAGAAIDLHTQTPTPEQIKAAVEEMLGDRKYTLTAKRLAERYAEFQPVDMLVKTVEELVVG